MLTITADDFGIGFETSRGIVECYRAGAVDRTSVMVVTGEHLERSLPLLEGVAGVGGGSGLGLGLHLTLTSRAGRALVATKSSGLVDDEGYFLPLGKLLFRGETGKLSEAGVEEEIRAQVEKYRRVIGREPDHLDGHHHAHQAGVVRRVVGRLVREGVLPARVRNTMELPETKCVGGAWLRRQVIRKLGVAARLVWNDCGAKMPAAFAGVLTPGMLRRENPWGEYVASIPADMDAEIMVHPGYEDPTLEARDGYLKERVKELAALMRLGPAVKG